MYYSAFFAAFTHRCDCTPVSQLKNSCDSVSLAASDSTLFRIAQNSYPLMQ